MMELHPSVYWLLFGLVAICIEVLAPGISMLGTGLAALATGVMAYFFVSLGLTWQLFLFSCLSVILTWLCKKWISKSTSYSDRPTLNEMQKELIGYMFYTTHPIEKGRARMQICGTYWTVEGPDLPTGSKVSIVKILGSQVVVTPCE